MKSRLFKGTIIGFLSFFLFTATGFQSAHAMDKSRVFTWLLFFSGLGSSAAGAVMKGQANEMYDEYLHTAVQADMDQHIDDYNRKNQQSIIASRAGVGIAIGAILLSLLDAAYIPMPKEQEEMPLFGSEHNSFGDQIIKAHTRNGEILFAVGCKF